MQLIEPEPENSEPDEKRKYSRIEDFDRISLLDAFADNPGQFSHEDQMKILRLIESRGTPGPWAWMK